MTESAPVVKIVSPRRALVFLGIVCMLFAAMGVVIIALAPTQEMNLIVGTLAIGFFGVGGGIALVGQLRKSVPLRADDEGLRLGGGGRIPWEDVDRIGATTTALGVRMRRFDTFLATVPKSAGHTAESLRAARAQTGWDLAWESRLLDRSPGDAARDLQRRRRSS
ncbi:hypothetical protein GCM10022240_22140 [Microbacterium kribbense]|uniref:Uncharacterized protein n=1 Tax=Microbacterium kribbense TaxID=433645 RepID=A0ABP7GMG4_9MICO